MFKVNQANWERIARVVIGVILLYVGLGVMASSALAVLVAVLGAVALLTGIVGVCPLYMLLKFSTKK